MTDSQAPRYRESGDAADQANSLRPARADGPAESAAPQRSARNPRDRRRRARWIVRLCFWPAVAGALVWMFANGLDDWFYHPSRQVYYTPDQLGLRYEASEFLSRDGVRLSGWFLPAEGPARGTVVHFHGNAENMTSHILFVEWVPRAGYNLLVFDYRGYGRSEGRVSRTGTVLDGHAALDYVCARPDVDPRRVFVFGQSLGGAVAIVVCAERAAQRDVRAIAVDSTFSSYQRIAELHIRRMMPLPAAAQWLSQVSVSDGHDPVDVVAQLGVPLLVIASAQDDICFPELSRELYDAAHEPKRLWVVEGGHTAALQRDAAAAQRTILEWFERAP